VQSSICSLVKLEFTDIITGKLNKVIEFEAAKEFTNRICEMASPVQIIWRNQSEERKYELTKIITEAVDKYADINADKISFHDEVLCITEKK